MKDISYSRMTSVLDAFNQIIVVVNFVFGYSCCHCEELMKVEVLLSIMFKISCYRFWSLWSCVTGP
jgi:hypothetical protein